MRRIAVIYSSGTGTTAGLAEALGTGAAESAAVVSYRIVGTDTIGGRFANGAVLQAADAADGIAFGGPTYMGGPAAQFEAFADATGERWMAQRWAGKVACGFTTGGCANGDQGHTLSHLAVLAAQHGMLWCGLDIPGGLDPQGRNRLGAQLGLASQAVDGVPHLSDLETARHLGRRLARVGAGLAVGRPAPC